MTYYNTTRISGPQLSLAYEVSTVQDDMILSTLMVTGEPLTAWQLKDLFPHFEITSIRRSLNTLCVKERKIDFIKFVMGPKGRPVGLYQIKK